MARRAKTASLPSRRNAALDGVPRQIPPVRTEEKDGKLLVTLKFRRPRWQRFLGADEMLNRTFRLDKYGQQVYTACDGDRSVRQIVKHFAKATKVSEPEAELAVAKFMHTLIVKGLVAIEMEKPAT